MSNLTADQQRELSKKKIGTYFGEKKPYIALVDQLGTRKGFWKSGEIKYLTDEQAKEKLEKGKIGEVREYDNKLII